MNHNSPIVINKLCIHHWNTRTGAGTAGDLPGPRAPRQRAPKAADGLGRGRENHRKHVGKTSKNLHFN